ncbi:MAG: exodeoxyribonuclease VII large subunit [Siculibacillus sp.]|nr:exodeoxyribonuclease VII large subunit [Siculibacillus sp.]
MAEALPNVVEFTVSELSRAVKRTIEDGFGFVRVRGEISGWRGPHSSGHAYFALKDEGAKIDAVVWKGTFSKLRFRPEEGMEVIATGRMTTFPGSSKYQIVIEALEPAGVGALMALLEERKKKLAAEGLFDAARKVALPRLPKVVGVVTSPTGAVIRDILHRIADRFPVRVIVWPVRVQGETSAEEVANAISGFDAIPPSGRDGIPRPDVVIVARGGGSLEDLWSFNEEIVVRAVAACSIPLVSAIGHETDWTLIDLAADLRAPTPTGAAEMVLPVRVELVDQVATLGLRISGAVRRGLEVRRTELRSAARALPTPQSLLETRRQRFDLACGRLTHALSATVAVKATRFAAIEGRLSPAALSTRLTTARERLKAVAERGRRAVAVGRERRAARLDGLSKLLAALSYRGVLSRGYALVRDAAGRPVRLAAGLTAGMGLDIEFADGRIAATVAGDAPPPAVVPPSTDAASSPQRPRRRPGRDPSEQGSLF